MKNFAISLILIVLLPLGAIAQTVTLDSVSTPTTCDTARVTVYYTASGAFGAKNVFTVQLSEPDGTFTNFTNAGSLKSTTSGSITITMSPGNDWRVRVASSSPYIVSNDNGNGIAIQVTPVASFSVSKSVLMVGDSVLYASLNTGVFFREDTVGDSVVTRASWDSSFSYYWDFGSDATPSTSNDSAVAVTYNSLGIKHTSFTVGHGPCLSAPDDHYVYVYGCTPAISSTAIVDSEGMDINSSYDTSTYSHTALIWVVPGAALTVSELWDTHPHIIFAEPGSTINDNEWGGGDIIYLKAGAVLNLSNVRPPPIVIIYEPGSSILGDKSTANIIECSSLSFDYTSAPPYKITWAAGVTPNEPAGNIRVYPNPATNLVTIASPEIPRSIVVRNELGEVVLSDNGPIGESNIEFDVSRFTNGVYYIDLGIGNGKQTVKFTVAR